MGREGEGERERKIWKPSLTFYIYLDPNSSHCVYAEAKAQQSSSIRSLFVWLYSSRQENSRCCITQVVKHWKSESRYRPEVKHIQLFYASWNRDRERREWDLRHYVCCNDTPPTAGCRSAEILKYAPLFPCFHLGILRVVTRDCGWVLCEKQTGMLWCSRLTV